MRKATRGKVAEQELLTPDEIGARREKLEDEKRYLKGVKREEESDGMTLPHGDAHGIDEERIKRRIEREEKYLKEHDPRNVPIRNRKELESEYRKLHDWLRKSLHPRRCHDMFPSTDHGKNRDFEKAVDWAQKEMSREFVQVVERYRRLGLLLWPDDPDRRNYELLRGKGRY